MHGAWLLAGKIMEGWMYGCMDVWWMNENQFVNVVKAVGMPWYILNDKAARSMWRKQCP